MDTLRRIIASLAELLWPARCAGCGRVGSFACDACLQGLCPARIHQGLLAQNTNLNRLIPATPLTKTAEAFVYALKYRGVQALAPLLANRMCDILALRRDTVGVFGANPLIIPVPLHTSRLKERGFNQAELLARRIATTTMMPIDITSLIRTRATGQQAKQSGRAQRRDNMEGAFAVIHQTDITNRDIILIDDVCTTGATLNDCARALHDGGARSVSAIVFAHG